MAKLKGQQKPPTALAVVRQALAVKYREKDMMFRSVYDDQIADGLGNRQKAEALEDGEAVLLHGWEIKDHLPASAGVKLGEHYTLTEDNRLVFGERS